MSKARYLFGENNSLFRKNVPFIMATDFSFVVTYSSRQLVSLTKKFPSSLSIFRMYTFYRFHAIASLISSLTSSSEHFPSLPFSSGNPRRENSFIKQSCIKDKKKFSGKREREKKIIQIIVSD